MDRFRNERGMALPLAIFALVVIGGLVAGAMFVATQEQRIGRNTLRQQAAFAAAEAGAQSAVLNWNASANDSVQIGGTLTTTATAPDGQSWYRVKVRRLGPNVFLVQSDGFDRDSTTRSRVGMLVRLTPLAFNIRAGLETQGNTRVGGSSQISGEDSVPSGWTGCPTETDAQPGIRIADSTTLNTFGSCSGDACITGEPKVQQDTTINDSTLTTVGDIPFDSLQSYASKVISGGNFGSPAPSLNGTACNTGDLYNWGDPLNPTAPCGSYFPIIWSQSSLQLQNGEGQGVLIVNGNLKVTGTFSFFGPVLVRGELSTQGTGGHFIGGVIAATTALDTTNTTSITGNAVINYSNCAIMRALRQSANISVFKERSWVNLY